VNVIVRLQNAHFDGGVNLVDKIFFCFNGKIARIKIDATKAITPPSLLGMDRKIA